MATRSQSVHTESNAVELGPPTLQGSQPEIQTESNPGTEFGGSTNTPEIEYNSKGDKILSKSHLRSTWWENFQRIRLQKNGLIKARCLYCNKKLGGDARNGTTHLADHSKSCLKKKMVEGRQTVLTSAFMMGEGKRVNLQTYSFDQEVSRKQLAHMIIIHEYPLSIVEHIEFRKFFHTLQPGFKVVCRTTLKGDILKLYDVERMKTMRVLERVKSRISFTTDMWTS